MKVKFYPPKVRDSKTLALGDVTVADGITVRGFRVFDGTNGVFAAVPTKPVVIDGETRYFKQVVFETPEMRERFLSELLEDFYRWKDTEGNSSAIGPPPTPVGEGQNGGPPF
jgi:DNA-binding cell septation regulator SpoVG